MFDFREFTLNTLINGVKKGIFAKEYASKLAIDYLLKGVLLTDDIKEFDKETTVSEEILDNDVEIEEQLNEEIDNVSDDN